jgi:hypothetical protein
MAWWDMRVHAGMVIMHATMEKCILVWWAGMVKMHAGMVVMHAVMDIVHASMSGCMLA